MLYNPALSCYTQ